MPCGAIYMSNIFWVYARLICLYDRRRQRYWRGVRVLRAPRGAHEDDRKRGPIRCFVLVDAADEGLSLSIPVSHVSACISLGLGGA